MRIFRAALLAFALIPVIAFTASADTITFVHTGAGSGSLAGNPFAFSQFTITATGDTTSRGSCGGTCFFIDHVTASITIGGLGTFSFTTGTRTFMNNGNGTVGFSRAGSGGLDLYNGPSGLPFWDMLSSFGPVSGATALLQWTNSPVNTSGGVLVFNNAGTEGTFTARVGTAQVPEPTSLLILGLGLTGLFTIRRRR